ncbi:MAG TPA: ATP-binding protein, partial [Acidimicrobiales bacterium]|nr:ATP-binding protein [Acidimicrobiales bacterium]
VVIAAVVAALLALSAGLVTSRRLVAPLRRLTSAVARLGSGDRSSRVGPIRAAGEIRQLGETFDAMAADLQSEDRLRRALVADVAHELRTPVAILRAELEAVSVGIRPFEPATVESLTEEVDRLSRLVEDLGVLAAAEAASLGLERTRVDLSVVAARAADRLASRVREADVRLERQLSPADVLGDPGRLEQVVVNLLSNAVKFSPRKATVELAVSRRDGEVRLAVSDEGPGIPVEEQPRVFERFYRGQGAAGTPGSGVGLAVVAAIVSAHGGRVALESAPGRGTTFEVVLPAAPAD